MNIEEQMLQNLRNEVLKSVEAYKGFEDPFALLGRLKDFLLSKGWDQNQNKPDDILYFLRTITMTDRINNQPYTSVETVQKVKPLQPVKFKKPVDKCGKCGILLTSVMNYYCNDDNCPTGLGSPKCQS